MRLSLMKVAHAALDGAAYRKSGYLAFFARCGKYHGYLPLALGNFDRFWRLQTVKIRDFPHLAKDARYGAPKFAEERIPEIWFSHKL